MILNWRRVKRFSLFFKLFLEKENQNNVDKNKQNRLLASLFTLSVFAKVESKLLIPHVYIFLPYLSIAYSNELEYRVINQV